MNSLDSQLEFTRQEDIISMDKLSSMEFTIIGVGSVGSFTALSLAKMGARNITIYDDDRVEAHNLPNQFYRVQDLDKLKVDALKEIVKDYADVDITAHPIKYDGEMLKGIVISSVDSMDARHEIWDMIKGNPMITHYIDSRMGPELSQVIVSCPVIDKKLYEFYLWDPKDVPGLPCTAKSIIYTVQGLSGIICGKVKKIIQGQEYNHVLNMDYRNSYMYKEEHDYG